MKVEKIGKRNPSSFSFRKSQFDMFVPMKEECYFYFVLLQIAYSKIKQCLKYGCLLSNRQILIFSTDSYCRMTALGSQPVSVGDHRFILLRTLLLYFLFTRIAGGFIWIPLFLIAEDLSWFLKVNSYLACELSWYSFHTGLLGRQMLYSVIWSETSINSFYLLFLVSFWYRIFLFSVLCS